MIATSKCTMPTTLSVVSAFSELENVIIQRNALKTKDIGQSQLTAVYCGAYNITPVCNVHKKLK